MIFPSARVNPERFVKTRPSGYQLKGSPYSAKGGVITYKGEMHPRSALPRRGFHETKEAFETIEKFLHHTAHRFAKDGYRASFHPGIATAHAPRHHGHPIGLLALTGKNKAAEIVVDVIISKMNCVEAFHVEVGEPIRIAIFEDPVIHNHYLDYVSENFGRIYGRQKMAA